MEFQETVHEGHTNKHTVPYIHYRKDKYNTVSKTKNSKLISKYFPTKMKHSLSKKETNYNKVKKTLTKCDSYIVLCVC